MPGLIAGIVTGALATIGLVCILGRAHRRVIRRLFGLREGRMTIETLGLAIHAPEHRERVAGILTHFAGGFNTMLAGRTFAEWQSYCKELPSHYQPFAHVGAAMGYPLRRQGFYGPESFESQVVKAHPQFRYPYYAGLGFWGGIRGYGPRRLERLTRGLDPLYRYLCYEGYGFKHGLLDFRRDHDPFGRLMVLEGYARQAAFQGAGGALYFQFMDEPEELMAALRALGPYAIDAASGVGLASVFVHPDRLETACDVARRMDEVWHPAVHQGMCFGLKARYIHDVEQFEQDMSRRPASVREAVFASIRECDRIELQVRDAGGDDAYRQWREHLAAWMTHHVEYPLASYRSPARRLAP